MPPAVTKHRRVQARRDRLIWITAGMTQRKTNTLTVTATGVRFLLGHYGRVHLGLSCSTGTIQEMGSKCVSGQVLLQTGRIHHGCVDLPEFSLLFLVNNLYADV
jgi:hypothetical protein